MKNIKYKNITSKMLQIWWKKFKIYLKFIWKFMWNYGNIQPTKHIYSKNIVFLHVFYLCCLGSLWWMASKASLTCQTRKRICEGRNHLAKDTRVVSIIRFFEKYRYSCSKSRTSALRNEGNNPLSHPTPIEWDWEVLD